MSVIEAILYGLISGFSEFSPISSSAHQQIMEKLMNGGSEVLIIHVFSRLGMILALLIGSRNLFGKLRRDKIVASRAFHRRGPRSLPDGIFDLRVVRTAAIPMLLVLILNRLFVKHRIGLPSLSIYLLINGFFLFLSDHVPLGNKDAKSFSALDSLGLGIFGALAAVPGISRIGTCISYPIYRGVSRQTAYSWALFLSLPLLAALLAFDLFALFTAGLGAVTGAILLLAFTVMVFTFCGGIASIALMRFLMVGVGLSGFAFYSWGAALFTFFIYLLT